jgi:hypothetical protein
VSEDELVPWLRQRIRERRYLAEHTIELGSNAVWAETSTGVLVTGEPTEADAWHGTWAMGDSSLARLMEANDPQDTIARCEAELAILDEHQSVAVPLMAWRGCGTCKDPIAGPAAFPCRTVRLLATGYRHRDGYREEWAS